MRRFILYLILVLFLQDLAAQVYVDGGRTRHRFAQLELGLDQRFLSNWNTALFRLTPDNTSEKYALSDQLETRFIIGGTHFWGHADFYVAIPVLSWNKPDFKSGIETGARYYPWKIQHNKLRPYLGFSLNATHFKLGEGATARKVVLPFHTGMTFNRKNNLWELGWTWNYDNTFPYFLSKEQAFDIRMPSYWLTLGYRLILETTLGAEKSWADGTVQKATEIYAHQGKLNNFSIAFGPSSTWFLKTPEHNEKTIPYLSQPKVESVFWDLGLGYYWHRPDLHLNLAYRNIKTDLEGYGDTQEIRRSALTLEAFKFLFDFHGFVPFIGPFLSYENIAIREYQNQLPRHSGELEGLKPGIVFGWDIRPTRMQTWILRTNLRYTPGLTVPMSSGYSYQLDQIEFNFIQLVLYPQRLF